MSETSDPAQLVVSRDGAVLKSFALNDSLLAGRGEGCGVWLNDRAVSREHALFRRTGQAVQVESRSQFGALSVNGQLVTQAILNDRDIVQIGPYALRLNLRRVPDAAAPTETATSNPSGAAPSKAVNALEKEGPLGSGKVPSPQSRPKAEAVNGKSVTQDGAEIVGSEAESKDPSPDPIGAVDELELSAPAAAAEGGPGPSEEEPALSILDGIETAAPPEGVAEPQYVLGEEGPSPLEVANPAPGAPPAVLEAPSQLSQALDENAPTRELSARRVLATLTFKAGEANATDYALEGAEVAIGRDPTCQIILQDKKSSRRHCLIQREGVRFFLKDLETVNGTYLNGERITEALLSGGDLIRIGSTEFSFTAHSADFAMQEQALAAANAEADAALPQQAPLAESSEVFRHSVAFEPASPAVGGLEGIAGINGPQLTEKKSLLDRFKAMSKLSQGLIVGLGLFALYEIFLTPEDSPTPNPAASPKPSVSPSGSSTLGPIGVSFESLPLEQQRFVVAQHDLAFNYYKHREYDKALFEIQKIFDLGVDYEDSREIEQYSKDQKRKLEAEEEERKKKEENDKLRIRVAALVAEVQRHMDHHEYDVAKELFAQVLALDPDNPAIQRWNKLLEEHDRQLQALTQQKEVERELNQQGWALFKVSEELRRAKKYSEALSSFQSTLEIGAKDPTLNERTRQRIRSCQQSIAHLRDPLLAQGVRLEKEQDYVGAYQAYLQVTTIDPLHPAAYEGIKRVKGILHEQARSLYTEAIMAENFSDFASAEKYFRQCRDTAPHDDVYWERAQRKLDHFFKIKETQ